MPEPFSILKALDFSLPAIGKSLSIVIKGLLVLIVLWGLYVFLVKPHINPTPTTTQSAGEICNYYLQPRQTFGCMNLRVPKENVVKDYTNTTAVSK